MKKIKIKHIKDIWSYRGADVISDHIIWWLQEWHITFTIILSGRVTKNIKSYDFNSMKNISCIENYQSKIENKLLESTKREDIEIEWDQLKATITLCLREAVGETWEEN